MIIFMAFYFYILIQVIMASKWKDTDLNINDIKNKLSSVPSIVEKWTKSVKSKISDESVIVIEKAKGLTQKAWKTIKEWKDYVVSKYKDLKTKLNNAKTAPKKRAETDNSTIDEKSVLELIKINKELINTTRELVDKYEKSMKLLEQINKNLSKKK